MNNTTLNNIKPLEFEFITDPGHGWLAVDYLLLEDLDIHKTISHYSYRNRGIAYLEEDCDAQKLLQTLDELGIPYKISQRNYSDGEATLRRYNNYYVNEQLLY